MLETNVAGGIAIIGMACRVAGANSPSELWDLLATSKDVQSEITRFNVRGYYHPDGGPHKGRTNVKNAYMMDDDLMDRFDNAFFHTNTQEAIAMDPQQRMLLEVSYEALESAGIPLEKFVGTDTAVYAGMEGTDYHGVLGRDIDATPRYMATGPSMIVDTACSSTMAALHLAVRTLEHEDAKMAMVCGAKFILNPDMFMPSSELGFLSPSGRCRSFDAAGDGYGRGEGVAAIILKPLKTALSDGDPIRAVVRGTRLNSDGRTQGITLPSAIAQQHNMESLYQQINISPNDIQYIEAHGTGTAAGDPLECSAINAVFASSPRNHPLVVGSIKSNIGHLEASAALAAIIKTVQCLEKGSIPPQMHFVEPNPKIDFDKLHVPVKMMSWPAHVGTVRRAAINTFGAGGTNGHCVIEAYPAPVSDSHNLTRPLLLKVSAEDKLALGRLCVKYADYIQGHTPNLYDLAYTLLSRRSSLKETYFFTASDHVETIRKLRAENSKTYPKQSTPVKRVAFIFTGQGAQWPGMSKTLIEHSPFFRNVLLECEAVLASLGADKPEWSITDELLKSMSASKVYDATYSQAICTAIQIGLVLLWKHWGLFPTTVVGHSSGEIAAAYAAGFISLRDAMVIAYYRGLYVTCLRESKHRGMMCAVGMSEQESRAMLEAFDGRVQLAAINSPTSCTLSGDRDVLKQIITNCHEKNIFCRILRSEIAYHSHHMLLIASKYEDALINAKLKPLDSNTVCTMLSSARGTGIAAKDCSPSYWMENMVSTVNYYAAVEECLKDNPKNLVLIEIGPHPALRAPTQEILRLMSRDTVDYFHTLVRHKDDMETLLGSAGVMIARGIPLKVANINGREVVHGLECAYEPDNVLNDLPSYSWDHFTSFWSESRVSRNIRYRQHLRHDLLGSRYQDDVPSCPSWRNLLMLKEVPWLMKMKDDGVENLPPTAFILMALEAASQVAQASYADSAASLHLYNLHFAAPLSFTSFSSTDTTVEFHLCARQIGDTHRYEFEIFSIEPKNENKSTRHCSGRFGRDQSVAATTSLPDLKIEHDEFLLDRTCNLPQPWLERVTELKISSVGATGTVEFPSVYHCGGCMDPVALDSLLRLPALTLSGHKLPAVYKIKSIRSLTVPSGASNASNACFTVQQNSEQVNGGQYDIIATLNASVLAISNVVFEVDHLLSTPGSLKSLYFRPIVLPDISRLQVSSSRTLELCLKLLTHKWPMCDIGATDLGPKEEHKLRSALPEQGLTDRAGFRSFQISSSSVESPAGRLRYVSDFDATIKLHMIFAGNAFDKKRLKSLLLPKGFACVPSNSDDTKVDELEGFSKICEVTGINEEAWILWHLQTEPVGQISNLETRVFICPNERIDSITSLGATNTIQLSPAPILEFCQRCEKERYHAVVVDCTEKSIISTWSGKDLLPWLQDLLKSADALLWVTWQKFHNPFTNIAGTLLRTIQSEQPKIKITWLVFKADEPLSIIQDTIADAFSAMLSGENEVRLEVDRSEVSMLRYRPDEELSAFMGLSSPKFVAGNILDKDYSVSLSAPKESILLSSDKDRLHIYEPTRIRVQIEASVIDVYDVLTYNGARSGFAQSATRNFFAGTVLSTTDHEFSAGRKVVGWNPSCHYNEIEVLPAQMLSYGNGVSPALAAAQFAVLCTALCVLDGTARARQGDTIRSCLDPNSGLGMAIVDVCVKLGAAVIVDGAADFLIDLHPTQGILVNGSQVAVDKYLASERGIDSVARIWSRRISYDLPLKVFDIADHRQALEAAQTQPYTTVLLHTGLEDISRSLATYKKASSLFSEDAIYVIIGGLGGLGRFICSWMISNGAKRLVSISRSGLQSDQARQTWEEINATSASLVAIVADARDRRAISNALSQIRESGSINGVINMAMLLGDAPLETMEGWQWDLALRLKIDSSWILHEETLSDPLEFFILFSSIASVLGNRNQAGYNVGNTFLNALAEYRRSLGMTAISVALGAMIEVGILHELGRGDLLQTLSRSGLTPLRKRDLAKIMEAAVVESHRSERHLIVTGLDMFDRINGKLVGSQDQTQLYWTELPEFGFLQRHSFRDSGRKNDIVLSVREQVANSQMKEVYEILQVAFLRFVAGLLGFEVSVLDPVSSLTTYGLDSLSGVSCQYWFHRELSINMSVAEVLNATSISQLIGTACTKLSPGP